MLPQSQSEASQHKSRLGQLAHIRFVAVLITAFINPWGPYAAITTPSRLWTLDMTSFSSFSHLACCRSQSVWLSSPKELGHPQSGLEIQLWSNQQPADSMSIEKLSFSEVVGVFCDSGRMLVISRTKHVSWWEANFRNAGICPGRALASCIEMETYERAGLQFGELFAQPGECFYEYISILL